RIRWVEGLAHVGLSRDAEAILLVEPDGHPAAAADEAARIEEQCRNHGATTIRRAASPAEAVELATARRSAFSALARLRPTTTLDDVTVPRRRLAGMVHAVQAIAEKHRLTIATFGHFGDGNLHPTILTDERDTEEMHRVELALSDIVDEALKRGGTITGEHGVGLAKKPFLRRQMG